VKNGRLLQVVIGLISFIVGGGATAAVSYSQYTKLDTKIQQVDKSLHQEFEKDQSEILIELRNMNKRLSRIEGRLEVR